jgi:hypothetical protein
MSGGVMYDNYGGGVTVDTPGGKFTKTGGDIY